MTTSKRIVKQQPMAGHVFDGILAVVKIVVAIVEELILTVRLFFCGRVPWGLKVLFVIGSLGAAAWVINPADPVLTQIVPGLNMADDLAVVVIVIESFIQLCPKDVVKEMRSK